MTDKPDLGADGPAALARASYVAIHRGRVVARQVASTPLDQWHAEGRLTPRQYEAGQRLRFAYDKAVLTRSSLVVRPSYGSEASDLDEQRPDETDEQRGARQRGYSRLWMEARDLLGPVAWSCVRSCVCDGRFHASPRAFRDVRAGLTTLADEWKIP